MSAWFKAKPKMKPSFSAGGVVLNTLGQVLVVSQRGKSWSLPKGHIDEGENVLDAAKREILEETGITQLEYVDLLGQYSRYKIGKHGQDDPIEYKTIHLFLFKTTQMDLKPIDPKHPEARWVDKENVAPLLTHPKDKEFFLSILPRLTGL